MKRGEQCGGSGGGVRWWRWAAASAAVGMEGFFDVWAKAGKKGALAWAGVPVIFTHVFSTGPAQTRRERLTSTVNFKTRR